MMFDRMLSFFENDTVPADASKTTAGRVVDMRLNGPDIDNQLKVFIGAVGAAPSAQVTTLIQQSDDGSAWEKVAEQKSSGNTLFKGNLPILSKRFVRAAVTTGSALSKAIAVKGGIVAGEVEFDDPVKLQTFPPLQDVAATTVVEER